MTHLLKHRPSDEVEDESRVRDTAPVVAESAATTQIPKGAPLSLVLGGFVVLLCGAWFALVPELRPVIVRSYFHAASVTSTLEDWLALATGLGVWVVTFEEFAMGRAGRGAAVIK